VVGWADRIGALNYPVTKMLGREPPPGHPERKLGAYFRMTDDHKVVGLQYTWGSCCSSHRGLLAIGHQTELLSPTNHVFGRVPTSPSSASTAPS